MKKTLLSFAFAATAFIAQAQEKNFIDQPYIDVNGEADTLVTPDEIYLKITISEKDTRDRVSVETQEARMVEALKQLGINVEKDLVVEDMASNFKSYLLRSKDVLKTKSYELKLGDAVMLARVFRKLEELDIANADVTRVAHSQIRNLQSTMNVRAIQNARREAQMLTSALGQNLGGVLHIQAYNQTIVPYAVQDQVANIRVRGLSGVSAPAALDFEKIRVKGSASVKFAIR